MKLALARVTRFAIILAILCIVCVSHAALAQTPPAPAPTPSPWTLANVEHLFASLAVCGSALSAFLAVFVAQFPNLPFTPLLSKIATLLGSLPVLDFHGLTTGTMQVRLAAASVTTGAGQTLPAPPPPPASTKP